MTLTTSLLRQCPCTLLLRLAFYVHHTAYFRVTTTKIAYVFFRFYCEDSAFMTMESFYVSQELCFIDVQLPIIGP